MLSAVNAEQLDDSLGEIAFWQKAGDYIQFPDSEEVVKETAWFVSSQKMSSKPGFLHA